MRTIILLLMVILLFGNVEAQILPIPYNSKSYTPLVQARDDMLQRKLTQTISKNPQWSRLIEQKRLCVGLVDISNPDLPRFASINGDHMMYAASLPKVAILLAVMDAIEAGELKHTPKIDSLLHRMIRISCNASSTALIDKLGYDKIANVLQDERYRLYDEMQFGGGLWVGKRYAAGGPRNPEPIKGLSHAATVTQVCRFYYMLAYGKLISCDASEKMLEYLRDPRLHHKFVHSLNKLAPEAELYRKSGTWKNFHADSVMVIGNVWRSYILVALINDPHGEQIMREMVTDVDYLLSNN